MSLLIKLPRGEKSDEVVGRIGDELHCSPCTRQKAAQQFGSNESLVQVLSPDTETVHRKGRVQSAIAALFNAQPDRVFTTVDLAQAIHGKATRTTCKTIRRAADRVAREMGWTRRKMWGRVDYVRPESLNAIARLRAEKVARVMELSC